ncbi:MAG: preprotein translocase subunit SecE [Spirochaetia bacterium]|nr:preprotein translocase subunit SecE [Spirochaetia bacterium]MCF7953279.1 preprotein translocase subunit SecE [Spirochaetales bacterium]
MKKIIRFLKESYRELKRVVWPSRETVVSSTKVVLVTMIIFAVLLGFFDFILLRGLDLIW